MTETHGVWTQEALEVGQSAEGTGARRLWVEERCHAERSIFGVSVGVGAPEERGRHAGPKEALIFSVATSFHSDTSQHILCAGRCAGLSMFSACGKRSNGACRPSRLEGLACGIRPVAPEDSRK